MSLGVFSCFFVCFYLEYAGAIKPSTFGECVLIVLFEVISCRCT